MGMAVKVKMLLAAKGMSITELSNKIEPKTTHQNIGAKLKRDNLTEKDLRQIAKACDVTYEGNFIFKDGTKI